MPWLVLCVLALVFIAVKVTKGQWMNHADFKKARETAVYAAGGETINPVHFSLEGLTLDLNEQLKPDAEFKIPRLDNPSGLCGNNGEYGLCGY